MKYLYLILFLLLIQPVVLAVQTTPIHVEPMIRLDKYGEYSANIEIEMPEDIYDRTYTFQIRFNNTLLNSTNPNATETEGVYVIVASSNPHLLTYWESFSFDILRDFANQTELFDIVDTCSEYMENVTSCYTQTNSYRDKYDELFESTLSMVNLTHYNEITNNLTTELNSIESTYETFQRTKETEVADLQERIGVLEKHRQYGWGIGIMGVVSSIYLLNKYRGLGKRKHQAETEFPKDVSV